MTDPIYGKSIAVGVSGSIACYKAIDLISKLVQAGAAVDVMMTKASLQFVTPNSFASITNRPVSTNLFDPNSEIGINHVSIAERSDIVIIAPATAQTMARLALGFSDDPLTATVLATSSPVLICPAMDGNMYSNPATQENINKLAKRGYTIIGPEEGRLASGLFGKGRLVETSTILGHTRSIIGSDGDLKNKKIVISAGGTQEKIDPVRFITNRSSGKMGYAIAEAARNRGAETIIVAAPNMQITPVGTRVKNVISAEDMKNAIVDECIDADVIIMAAAVADWKPKFVSKSKFKKNGSQTWDINLSRNPDILAELDRNTILKVGFAAESENILDNAIKKIRSKDLDLIAANDISKEGIGFNSDNNKITLINREGVVQELELMSKYEIGNRILDQVSDILSDRQK